jgi:TPR repeat protein
LRALTAQIEAVRHQSAAPVAARGQVQQTLDEIVAPLMRAVPFRAIETLESSIVTLVQRIDASRKSGVEPHLLAPIEHGLSDVRDVLHRLQPRESLAAFQTALQDLTDRLSAGRGTRQVSPKPQIEAVITSLGDIAQLASSAETLTALSDEVRGLTARCERIVVPGSTRREHTKPAPSSAETLPVSIERSLKDINLRLDALQKDSPTLAALAREPGILNSDQSAQDALEETHAALSRLVGQLAINLRAPRDPRTALSRHEFAIDRPSPSDGRHHATRRLRDAANDRDSDFPQAGRHHHTAYSDLAGEDEPDMQRRTIIIPIRPLIFSLAVIVLAAVAGRVSMQLTDFSLPAITKADAFQVADAKDTATGTDLVEPNVPDLARSQAPDTFTPAPERQQTALALSDNENTGVIGRPVPVAVGAREAAREPSLPLPDTLPSHLRAEAAKGKPAAEYEVGVRLVEGNSAPVNAEEGLRWLRRAAKSGIIPAHLWIGSLYEKGQGVDKDLTLARTHYLAAAEKGNAKAMHNLAVLYAEGIDGRRDYKTASRWFLRAAERGIADSQYNLAVLLMRGIGVEQNHQDAYKWFALAALQGDREAARHRDELGRKLEPGLLAKATSAVQGFTPQTQPNEAVVVATPPGGWDRSTGETGAGRKSRSGIFARGAS